MQAPELLEKLFSMGSDLLIEKLPEVWSGEAEKSAVPQDDAYMTHAAKMSKRDGLLDFSQPAEIIHNKVCCLFDPHVGHSHSFSSAALS
jgi:methionyl-tRNA formyltransferase